MFCVTVKRSDLRALLNGSLVAVERNGVRIRVEPDRPHRTGAGPTFGGEISVYLSDCGRPYAFHTSIPVAVGDTVDVETSHGVVEGVVAFKGAGGYSGPLKDVLAVKAVR